MADRSQLFSDIDSLEPERFTQHLAEDVTMRFGNADEVHGRDAVYDVWAGFCEGVDGVSHSGLRRWESDEGTVAEADVTYTKKDGDEGHRSGGDDLPRGRRRHRRLPRLHRPRAAVHLDGIDAVALRGPLAVLAGVAREAPHELGA